MSIQWYPGHMAKTKRMLNADMKSVDAVLELIDARIPVSSRNPDLQKLVTKPRVVVLTKRDLADERCTKKWVTYYKEYSESVIAADLMHKGASTEIIRAVKSLFPDMKRAPRVLVVGIPNVGKSTLINRLTNRKGARVGAKPGVTRGKQWLTGAGLQLLDSPGILWPKFDDQNVARKLAIVASIRDEIFDQVEIAAWLLKFLQEEYRTELTARYGEVLAEDNEDVLTKIGRKRGCLLAGGVVDLERAALLVLKDFRTGRIGRISLDGEPNNEGV